MKQCTDYGEKCRSVRLFGHKYCPDCQIADETVWWEKITPAQRAAFLVWRNIRDRRGFRDAIATEIENSILEELAVIIRDAVRKQ